MSGNTVEVKLDKRSLKSAVKDTKKSASVMNLVYVSDQMPGFTRKRKAKGFTYLDGKKVVTDTDQLDRIGKLVIPPAWEQVWICKVPHGHLQATGYDVRKRKQYKYHILWSVVRNHTKFYRMVEFGRRLPQIRLQLEKDLALKGYPIQKVLAAAVSLLERTNIRVGNSFYENLYGSFGLTTLKDHHVQINGSKIKFTFKGKKGIQHCVSLKSKRLASIIKGCKDIPGKELIQFYDENGVPHSIDSGMVNDYIRSVSEGDFTAKDFRTWAGSVQALLAFKEIGSYSTSSELKQKIPEVIDRVARQLGNTRAICKKYYVHPVLVELYENQKLDKYISELDSIEEDDNRAGLTKEEKVMMKILESH